jgi:hypothetical protein
VTTIEQLQAHLERHSWPRLNCMLMVALSTAAAFLSSVLLLGSGVDSMALRYGAAALIGYVTFVLLLRGWVEWKRRQLSSESRLDLGDVVRELDIPLPRFSRADVEPAVFVGGRSGGGGASGSYGSAGGAPLSVRGFDARPHACGLRQRLTRDVHRHRVVADCERRHRGPAASAALP